MFFAFVIIFFAIPHDASAHGMECGLGNIYSLDCMSQATDINRMMRGALKKVALSTSDDLPYIEEFVNFCRDAMNCKNKAACDGIEDRNLYAIENQFYKFEKSCSKIVFLSGPFRECRALIEHNKLISKMMFPCLENFGKEGNGTSCGTEEERNECYKTILTGTCGHDKRYELEFIVRYMNKVYNCAV